MRRADFEGRSIVLIDSTKLGEASRIRAEIDRQAPATPGGSDCDFDKQYGVRWGPAPCRHIGACPFPDEAHADEIIWTDDLAEAEAAFFEAERQLLEAQ